MSLIIDTITTYLPANRKHTPSGWISFDSVCCHHRNERRDSKKRGGVHIADDVVNYHCFNCGFKATWQPGWQLTPKFKNLLEWLGVPDELITKCTFESLRLKDEEHPSYHIDLAPKFFDRALPMGARPIRDWIDNPPDDLLPVLEYLLSRGYTLDDYNWHWTDERGFNDRLIIPFFFQGRTVGYTARICKDRKTVKYLSEQQPGYVFNLDRQTHERKFVLVTEGPLDAVCVDGVAVMSNEIGPQQRHLISRLQREVVVIPDRDKPGLKLVEQAIDFGWNVSFPAWEPNIKDVNDAVRYYGKLYTLWSIVQAKESMPLKIQLRAKSWLK